MSKRLISATASEVLKMAREELKEAIKASEGRVICAESLSVYKPVVDELTTAELDVAFGADMCLLNLFDVNKPYIAGLNKEDSFIPQYNADEESIRKLKKYVGRPVGINLEPININADMMESRIDIADGRKVSEANLLKANELGCDFICITGNPETGVDNASILNAIRLAKKHFKGLIMAGKMHSSGVDEAVADVEVIGEFVKAGADIVLVPAIGTIQGFNEDMLMRVVENAHRHNALVMSTIGTSQEGASESVIEQMAIRNKVCGVDIQHIGDLSRKENIYAISMAIRGQRHSYNRIAQSINR